MQGLSMKEVRNERGKLVCRLNEKYRIVEIQEKNQKTLICFLPNGKIKVRNLREMA